MTAIVSAANYNEIFQSCNFPIKLRQKQVHLLNLHRRRQITQENFDNPRLYASHAMLDNTTYIQT